MATAVLASDTLFQSSPGPKAGCNDALIATGKPFVIVSILTRPESRVQRINTCCMMPEQSFQSSPGPKAGCNTDKVVKVTKSREVSILTRPESRVQLKIGHGHGLHHIVSILTRPESRVQQRPP